MGKGGARPDALTFTLTLSSPVRSLARSQRRILPVRGCFYPIARSLPLSLTDAQRITRHSSLVPRSSRAYHEVVPRADGFDRRHDLYTLYHYLNHYNLFGSGYYGNCERLFARLLQL
jgi:hypothetical protein